MALATIMLKGTGVSKEYDAGTAINPGYLVALAADGDVDPHGTAASNAMRMFALENELVGKGITDAYAVGERVKCWFPAPGSEVRAVLAANAPAIVIGDFLESAGNGTVRKVVVDAATDQGQRAAVVGQAIEAVDNSAGGSEAFISIAVI